jgi:hypothetical protein
VVKRTAKWLGRLLALLAAVAALAVAYLHLAGFPDFLTRMVVEQFRRKGLAAQFGSIRLDVLRGVVARDAALADAKTPDRPFAEVDELVLRFSWRRLLRRQNPLEDIRVANASLSVPMPGDGRGATHFVAENAYATVRLGDDGTVEIGEMTGLYCGIRLHVTGHLKLLATAPAAGKPSQAPKSSFAFVTRAVRELNRIRAPEAPQLDVDFRVDLARPLSSRVVVRFFGNDMQWRGVRVDAVNVAMDMQREVIACRQFQLKLYGGEVSIGGRYDIGMGEFDLRFSSTTDPVWLAALLPAKAGETLRDLRVRDNPKITARYFLSAETGSLPRLVGEVEAGAFDLRGVKFDAVGFKFDAQGPDVRLADVAVAAPEGKLTGHGEYNIPKRSFAYEFDSTLDPSKLLPLMWRSARNIVEPACFDTPPHIVASVRGDFVDPNAFAYEARLEAQQCSYRGVPLKHASATLHLRQGQLETKDLILSRQEGELRGSLLADFNAKRLSFDLNTTANPWAMAPLLGPKAGQVMRPYRFGPRTAAKAAGTVDFENTAQTAWTAQVTNEGFSYWKFTADRAAANLVFTNNTMRIEDFDADFYAGKLRGSADFAFARANASYRFVFDADGADVRAMMEAMRGPGREVTGVLSGHCELSGEGDDVCALRGAGNLEITDGILWQAPIFGIFSRILGNTKATSAKCTFNIADCAVKTDDLVIAAGAFTARSRGKLDFDGKMDFRVEAQFLSSWPGINIVSTILGKILEYKVGGTIGDPSYRPVNLPKELLPHED